MRNTPSGGNSSWATAVTANAINVTSYNTLYMRATAAQMSSWQGVWGLTNDVNPREAFVRQGVVYGAQTYALNIADLTGAYRVAFSTRGVYERYITVDKIWME